MIAVSRLHFSWYARDIQSAINDAEEIKNFTCLLVMKAAIFDLYPLVITKRHSLSFVMLHAVHMNEETSMMVTTVDIGCDQAP